jgi:hypothetical protein
MLFTTKAAVRNWNTGHLTKTIFHPDFKLGMNPAEESRLAKDFGLGVVAFDEIELDEFLHIWPECYYDLIEQHQQAHPDWTKLAFSHRFGVYTNVRFDASYVPPTFEQFDADMRVRLLSLEKVCVDFDAVPYGCDKSDRGIYRRENGKLFYLGIQGWLGQMAGRFNFLTTERLVTEVVRAAYRKGASAKNGKRRVRLACKHVEPPSELFPIPVQVFLDKRASARRVGELAREIIDANPNAFVICNGVKDEDRVLNFQTAKGANHLADYDIYVIITLLHPDHYARLNVVAQWLGIPDVIQAYYRDQISQAVGRNQGFRATANARKAVVITSPKLAASDIFAPANVAAGGPSPDNFILKHDNEFSPRNPMQERIQFEKTSKRPW